MYLLMKQRPDGSHYQTRVKGDEELIQHLQGTFDCTDHLLFAVMRIDNQLPSTLTSATSELELGAPDE